MGGIFLINAAVFKSVAGFKEHMKLNEDADLQVRLAEKGFFLHRVGHRIATHHTIFYFSIKRSIKRLLSGDLLYLGVFYRENLTNRYSLKKLLDMQKFTFALILSGFLSLLINPAVLLAYPALIMIRHHLSHRGKCSVLEYVLGIVFMDICLLLGFLLFYPKIKKVHYKFTIDQ